MEEHNIEIEEIRRLVNSELHRRVVPRGLDAEEITQEIALFLVQLRFRQQKPPSEEAIHELIKRRVIEFSAQQKSRPSSGIPADIVANQGGEISHSDLEDLELALKQLPDLSRRIFEYTLRGLNPSDIAQHIGLNERHVRRILSTSKKRLSDMIEGQERMPSPAEGGVEATSTQAIQIFIDPGGAKADDIRELLAALSEMQVAAGGLGLEFHIDGTFVVATEGAPT